MGALSPPLRENERNIMSIRTVLILSALALSVVAITAEVPEEVEFADSKTVFNRNGLSFLQSQWSTRRRTICHHGRTNYCQKHNAHQNRNQYCGRSCPHRVTDNSCTCCCMNHREFAAAKARHNANKRGARRRRTYRAPSRASLARRRRTSRWSSRRRWSHARRRRTYNKWSAHMNTGRRRGHYRWSPRRRRTYHHRKRYYSHARRRRTRRRIKCCPKWNAISPFNKLPSSGYAKCSCPSVYARSRTIYCSNYRSYYQRCSRQARGTGNAKHYIATCMRQRAERNTAYNCQRYTGLCNHKIRGCSRL